MVGATGFIGGRVVLAAEAAGHDVVRCGREIGSPGSLRADAIVWAAGSRDLDGESAREAHLEGPLRLLEAARPRRFVYLSSGEVYGRRAVPFREGDAPAPETAYGRLKLLAESALAEHAGDTSIGLLRVGVAYGPEQRGTPLIPSAMKALVERRAFATTSGDKTRDFVHVRDVAGAVVASVERPEVQGVVNVGSDREVPIGWVTRRLVRLCSVVAREDLRPLLRQGERPERPGDQQRYRLACDRASVTLGWRAETSLAAGLVEVVGAWSGSRP